MFIFRAVTDDSAAESGDRRLFLAGYLLPAEVWAEFSEAWDRELRRKPSINYLKMAEAQNLRGQFRHWKVEQKDKKLRRLADVIRRYNPASYEFSVSRTAFENIYKPCAPYGLGKPHFVGTFAIVGMVTKFIADTGLPDIKIEFIFDRQDGVSSDIRLVFDYMSENLSDAQQRLIKSDPAFEDDMDFLPLQAADMLAWHLRREHEYEILQPTSPIMEKLRGELHYITRLEPEMLARWAKHHRSLPLKSEVSTKSGWKAVIEEAEFLKGTGFKPPHGDIQEIAKARLDHLAKLMKR